jgi:hypothetical protein
MLYKPLANDRSLQVWVYTDHFEPVTGSRRAQFFCSCYFLVKHATSVFATTPCRGLSLSGWMHLEGAKLMATTAGKVLSTIQLKLIKKNDNRQTHSPSELSSTLQNYSLE